MVHKFTNAINAAATNSHLTAQLHFHNDLHLKNVHFSELGWHKGSIHIYEWIWAQLKNTGQTEILAYTCMYTSPGLQNLGRTLIRSTVNCAFEILQTANILLLVF